MVGRDILACAQPNRHEIFTVQRFETTTVECPRGGDVRKYASAEERAAKNQKTTAILVLRRKYTDFRARFAHVSGSAIINAIVGSNMKYLCM